MEVRGEEKNGVKSVGGGLYRVQRFESSGSSERAESATVKLITCHYRVGPLTATT